MTTDGRFMKMYYAIARNDELSIADKFVLTYLMDYESFMGNVWPGIAKIANAFALSTSQVSRSITHLESLNLLATKRGKKRIVSFETLVPSGDKLFPSVRNNVTPAGNNVEDGKTTNTNVFVRAGDKSEQLHLFAKIAKACFPDLSNDEIDQAERSRIGRAAKMMVGAGVTESEFDDIVETWREKWPTLDLTPMGLANNVTKMRQKRKESSSDYLSEFQIKS